MNKQSEASVRWQEKAGYTVKGFKIKKDLAEAFAKACQKRNVSQAAAISDLMMGFINETKSIQ